MGELLSYGSSKKWRLYRFGQLFDRIERPTILDDSKEYNCVGIRWYGLGTFIRDRLLGLNIKRKRQWIIREGDIVFNKLFAWKGAFAVADSVTDGCIVSDKFPTYTINRDLIDLSFARYFFMTESLARQAQGMSRGAAAISKLTLNPPEFNQLTIPLPDLPEQQRIVSRIEALAGKIEEARRLRGEASLDSSRVLQKLTADLIKDLPCTDANLSEFVYVDEIRNGKSLSLTEGASDVQCLRLSALRDASIDCTDSKPVPMSFTEALPYLVRNGDVLIMRGNGSKSLVGTAGIVSEARRGIIFPDLFIRIPLMTDFIEPEYFVLVWNSPVVRKTLESVARTTSGIWKINQKQIISAKLPLPSLRDQKIVIEKVRELRGCLSSMHGHQRSSNSQLDALLPAILDRAFKGEL